MPSRPEFHRKRSGRRHLVVAIDIMFPSGNSLQAGDPRCLEFETRFRTAVQWVIHFAVTSQSLGFFVQIRRLTTTSILVRAGY